MNSGDLLNVINEVLPYTCTSDTSPLIIGYIGVSIQIQMQFQAML